MASTIKLLANSANVTTTNTTSVAKNLYIVNTDTVPALITVFDTVANTQYASIIIAAGGNFILRKAVTDVFTANNSTKCFFTPVGGV